MEKTIAQTNHHQHSLTLTIDSDAQKVTIYDDNGATDSRAFQLDMFTCSFQDYKTGKTPLVQQVLDYFGSAVHEQLLANL